MAEFLTFGAQELLKKVASLAAQEFDLVWGFNGEITKLRESVLMLEAMLRDAEHPRQDQGEAVKLLVKKLEDIAQHADDVLDDYGYELLRRKVQLRNQMKKKVQDFFSLSNPIIFRVKMAQKIKKINTSLDELNKKAGVIGLVARRSVDATTSHGISIDRVTCSQLKEDENNIIGRDDVVVDIVQALTKSNHNLESDIQVLAIVGMGGLGKTTLAQSIYNKSEITKHFDKKMWICVSNHFEVDSILRGILEYLKPENAAVTGRGAISKILQEELKKQRYLLILDDVWNEDAEKWNALKSCLLGITDAQGSSIVVTTRKDKVAEMVKTLRRCDLRKLSDDECWLILKNRAVPVGSVPIFEDQETIGREIAKKCAGVPLVAKVLGSIMRSNMSNEWRSIVKSEIWNLTAEEDRIMSILKLSFDELKSSSLKQCFAYCSEFIKDSVMEKDDLVQLWMAQGWLHLTNSNMEMEDKGNEYFNILSEQSLFEDFGTDYNGNTTCKMHDLVHDLAERVSNMTNSRSLFSKGEALGNTLPNFRSLRVLNLYKADIDKLPSSIGKLTHLRYLNVMKTEVMSFPKSIGQLYYLQTLKMPYHVKEFPKMIANMINLRHVYFGKHAIVPVGVLGRLTNLRSLPFLKVGKETGPRIEELGGLNYLRGTLSIYNLEHVRDGEEAVNAKLVDKKHIRELTLDWKLSRPSNNVDNEDVILEGLRPHCNLEILKIQGFMGVKFPSWFLDASNLKELELVGCNKCEGVPILGHLPNLIHVKMKDMQNLRCLGSEFYGYDQISGATTSDGRKILFPALRSLHIENAENLIDWMEPGEVMLKAGKLRVFPYLEKLTLEQCEQLRSAPSHFPSLKKLVIRGVKSGKPIASILSNKLTTLTYLGVYNCPGLRYLSDGLLPLSLEALDISNCSSLESIPIPSEGLPSLWRLWLYWCPELSLPSGLGCCTSLVNLSIKWCRKVTSIPIGSLSTTLRSLCVDNPESLPILHGGFTSLRQLDIERCQSTQIHLQFCAFLQNLVSLEKLTISECRNLETVPSLDKLTSLRRLTISGCSRLTCLPSGLAMASPHVFTRLKSLTLGSFWKELDSYPALQVLPQLETLTIWGWPKLKSLPEQIQHLTSLTYLRISSFDGVEAIPEWLGNLASLHSLDISGCKELMYLPSVQAMQRLTKLGSLYISICPLLSERCTAESGPEWPKISHIPSISGDLRQVVA